MEIRKHIFQLHIVELRIYLLITSNGMCFINFFYLILVLFVCYPAPIIVAEIGPYHGKVVACYWTTWSTHRPGRGQFQLENVDPTLCTHLIFAFALLGDTDNVEVLGTWPDLDVDQEQRNNITKLKNRYPHLKVLVSVGGWQDGSIKYSKMAAHPEKRRAFVNNTVDFIRKHNFDGLDLVWEFPTKRGGTLHDKVNFLQLIKELKAEYQNRSLLLTAALGASKDTIDNAYEVAELSLYLDYIFMMCYDYAGQWSRVTGPNAPLHGPDLLNVEYTIKHMLKLGADSEKMILGVPFYGRTYLRLPELVNASTPPELGEKFQNQTFNGSYTEEEGFIAYNEICLELLERRPSWSVYWDGASKTPYAVNQEKLICYDNDVSIAEKVKFAMDNDLGGVMVWSIDMDDFRGDCYELVDGRKEYPLLRTIDKQLLKFVIHHRNLRKDANVTASAIQNRGHSIFKRNYLMSLLMIWFNLQVGI